MAWAAFRKGHAFFRSGAQLPARYPFHHVRLGRTCPCCKEGKEERGDDAQFQMHIQEIEAQERERKKDEQPKPKA